MKRTTIVLPDDLATLVEFERKKQDVSAAEIVRRALACYLTSEHAPPKRLSFIGIGRGSGEDIASRTEEILDQEWAEHIRRESGLDRDR